MSQNSYYNNILESSGFKPLNITIAIISSLILIVLIIISLSNSFGLYLLAGSFAVTAIYFMVKYPKVWIIIIVLSNSIFFITSDKGVSELDVLLGLFMIGSLILWMCWHILVLRKKLLRNIFDWLLIMYYILVWVNSIIAMINGVTFLEWIRMYFIFYLVLFYFPVREYFNTKRDLKLILLSLLFVVLVIDFNQFYLYYETSITRLTYVYQIAISVRINQLFLCFAILMSILFTLNMKNLLHILPMIILIALSSGALIISFSRTFWVLLICSIFISSLFLPLKNFFKLYLFSMISFIILFTIINFYYQDKFDLVVKVIENRMSSTTRGVKDPSVLTRFAEYEAALKYLKFYPMSGRGMQKVFNYINPATGETERGMNIHNVYIYHIANIGFPFLIILLIVYIGYIIKGFQLSLKIKDPFYKALVLGSFLAIIMTLGTGFVANVIFSRDSVFVIAYSIAFISIAERYYLTTLNGNTQLENAS